MDGVNDSGGLLVRHKLDVDDYYRMASAGILTVDDRVELIDGEIIDMAPIGQDHAATVNALTTELVLAFARRAVVQVQNPVRIDRHNEPQPDFAVLRPRGDSYRVGSRPGPADTLLLIEVAESSLRYDRTIKLPLYARSGFAEVWITDLSRRIVEVSHGPGSEGYTERRDYRPGETITLALAPDVSIAVDAIFA